MAVKGQAWRGAPRGLTHLPTRPTKASVTHLVGMPLLLIMAHRVNFRHKVWWEGAVCCVCVCVKGTKYRKKHSCANLCSVVCLFLWWDCPVIVMCFVKIWKLLLFSLLVRKAAWLLYFWFRFKAVMCNTCVLCNCVYFYVSTFYLLFIFIRHHGYSSPNQHYCLNHLNPCWCVIENEEFRLMCCIMTADKHLDCSHLYPSLSPIIFPPPPPPPPPPLFFFIFSKKNSYFRRPLASLLISVTSIIFGHHHSLLHLLFFFVHYIWFVHNITHIMYTWKNMWRGLGGSIANT